ncbi:MAG: hypothetical protein AAF489_02110 [Bacteroidota bacterium]
MTGSVALDVVIGLVFIFLLYSLFASIIQEIIANILGLRARNLRHALTRMLEDDKDGATKDIFSRLAADSKQGWKRNVAGTKKELLKEFYKQPIIKYLASGRYFSKPSYIDQSDFSKAMMGILKQKGSDLLKAEGKEGEIALMDKITSALNDENDTLIEKETKKHLKDLLENSENNLQRFEANLEEWFNNMMDRASGWYKKTTQFNLFVIGFIIAAIFNVNAIAITKTLSTDEDARDSMVELASKFVVENKGMIEDIQTKNENTENNNITNNEGAPQPQEPSNNIAQDTTKNNADDKQLKDFEAKLDDLLEIKDDLQNDIAAANNVLGFKPARKLAVKGDSVPRSKIDSVKKTLENKEGMIGYGKESNKTQQYIVEFASASLAKNTKKYYYLEDIEEDDGTITTYAKLDDWKFFTAHFSFWGYLITALAISLGAAFWFDLLNKLIKLRGSIQGQGAETQTDSKA